MKIRSHVVSIGLFLFFLLTSAISHAQNISGVINIYTNVTAVASPTVTVGSTAGFNVGDRVLIIQMKGATINTPNNNTFGQITAYNDAGNYEYATILSITGNQVTFTGPLCQTYTVSGGVQMISVPVYANPNINATLTCQPWNGTTGGVLVFDVTGTLTFNSNIDVTGMGFRGGAIYSGGFGCNNNTYAANPHGKKGEGIADAPVNMTGGRAPLANGGGGSLNGNCGSGGGGNFGAGGRGGNVYSGCGSPAIWGDGGYNLTTVSNKAFLGGGGGGGFRDNGQTCAPGANGGGLVFINAPSIDGNGFTVDASGGDVTILTNDEGAGAGGGGGAVYIWSNTYTTALMVNVDGGSGGDIQNTIFTTNAHGPGGGGGGGYVWISQAVAPANLTVSTLGGVSGMVLHAGTWQNTSYNAADGNPGTILFSLPPFTPPGPAVTLGNDTTICPEDDLLLDAGAGFTAYIWQDGSTNQTFTTTGAGTYWVEVPSGCGGNQRDSIVITNYNLTLDIGPDTSFCQGDSVLYDAGAGYTTYAWNTGQTGQSVWQQTAGQYWVDVTDANGCQASDTAYIQNIFVITPLDLGNDTTICTGDTITLNASGYSSYNWNTAAVTPTIQGYQAGQYWVDVVDANNCTTSDTINLNLYAAPMVNLGNDTTLCPEFTLTLDAGAGFTSYSWQDMSTNQTYSPTTTGLYYVTATDVNTCTASDTIQVNFYNAPIANLGPDSSICSGETVLLNPGNFSSYNWWNASTLPQETVDAAGWYWVIVTDVNGCSDTDSMQIVNVYNNPVITLGTDSSFCFGESMVLNPGPGYTSYLWQDGSTNNTLGLTSAGTYHVTVTDINGCSGADTMQVVQVYPLPTFSLGIDFDICPGEQTEIIPSGITGTVSYRWNDDSNGSTLIVSDTGTYSLQITDVNGCVYSDAVTANYACPPTIYIPNAFTPNLDAHNTYFQAYGTNLRDFKMEIFNRWGELIVTLNGLTDSWDGNINDAPAPLGVYAYKVYYTTLNNDEVNILRGHVSLIR